MSLAPKIVLHTPISSSARLEAFVEECVRDKVVLIAVVGTGCEAVEDLIDELIIGDGSNPDRFITTASHPDQALDEVMQFVSSFSTDGGDADPRVEHVRL
ncbi:hypothetical protein [Desertibaculum subflavum]|uniref:hypothetical protein n=1 Tax=Desertibaculum subflavum TaxID=2268458 RepID=UPI000E670FF0